jgi:hypothetical protein
MADGNKKSRRQWEAYLEINANKIEDHILLKEMTADGYPEPEVRELLARYKRKSAGLNIGMMIGGGVFFLIGLALSRASYEAAYGGGTYYVFWGACLVGVVAFFIGLFRFVTKK